MYTGYVITGIKKDGLRHMSLNNNGSNTHKSREAAEEQLNTILNNPYNNNEHINQLGADLRIDAVQCYDHGDATKTIF